MSSTWQIPGYVSLARQAAAILGAHNDAGVRAILAQWQCEQPDPAPWPPIHNNPGNLTRDIGSLDGEPHRLASTAPGAGFLYSYATPEVGAAAYAHYLLNSRRYGAALAAIRAGNASSFLQHVCAAGYGTRVTCCLELLPHVTIAPPVTATPRWLCEFHSVNIRSGPGVNYRIVGTVNAGAVVEGWPVVGGPYHVNGVEYTGWLRLAGEHYTGHAFYRRFA